MKSIFKKRVKIALLSIFATIASPSYASDENKHGYFVEEADGVVELVETDMNYRTPEDAKDDFTKFCIKAGDNSDKLPSVQKSLTQIQNASDLGDHIIKRAQDLDVIFCMHSAIDDGIGAHYQYKFNSISLRPEYNITNIIHEIAHALQHDNGSVENDPEWDLISHIKHILMLEATAPVTNIIHGFEMKLNGDDSEWQELRKRGNNSYRFAITSTTLASFESHYQSKIGEGLGHKSAIEYAGNIATKEILMNRGWKNAYIDNILKGYADGIINGSLRTAEMKNGFPTMDQIRTYGDFGKYNISSKMPDDLFTRFDTNLLRNISTQSKSMIKKVEIIRREQVYPNKINTHK